MTRSELGKMRRRHPETTMEILSWVDTHLQAIDRQLKSGDCASAIENVHGAAFFFGQVYSRFEGSRKNAWSNLRFKNVNERLNRAKKQVIEHCGLHR